MSPPEGEYKSGRPAEPEQKENAPKSGGSSGGLSGAPSVEAEYGKGEDSYVGRVARGGGISTVGQGTGRVLGYLTQSAVARISATFFGLYTLTMAVSNFVNILSQFGFDNGVVRYVAHYRAQGDNERVRGAIIQCVVITFCISLVLATALFIWAGTLAGLLSLPEDAPLLTPLLRAVAFALPFFALMSILVWATQGFQTVTYATYVQQILRPLAYFLLVLGMYVATIFFLPSGFQGQPPTWVIVGIYGGFALSMMIGVVLATYFLRKLYPPLFDRSVKPKFETRALVTVSVPMSVQRVTQYTNNWTGALVLAQFVTVTQVGIYQAAFRTATLGTLVRYAFNGIFSPIISNLYSRGQFDDLRRLYKDVTRWTFTGALALFVPVMLLAEQALLAFGGSERFTSGWTALIILSGAQLFSTFVGPSPRMLAMTDNQNVVLIASLTGAITGVVATVALSPAFGIIGAAIGVSAAITTENTISLTMVRRRFGFWPFTPEYLKPTAAALIATAIAYGTKVGCATFVVSPGSIAGLALIVLVTGAVFEVFYLGLLWLFGLSESDREFLGTYWQVARRTLRRGNRGGGDTEGAE